MGRGELSLPKNAACPPNLILTIIKHIHIKYLFRPTCKLKLALMYLFLPENQVMVFNIICTDLGTLAVLIQLHYKYFRLSVLSYLTFGCHVVFMCLFNKVYIYLFS